MGVNEEWWDNLNKHPYFSRKYFIYSLQFYQVPRDAHYTCSRRRQSLCPRARNAKRLRRWRCYLSTQMFSFQTSTWRKRRKRKSIKRRREREVMAASATSQRTSHLCNSNDCSMLSAYQLSIDVIFLLKEFKTKKRILED